MENLSEACDWKFVVSSHFEFSTLYSLEGRDMIVGLMPQPFVFFVGQPCCDCGGGGAGSLDAVPALWLGGHADAVAEALAFLRVPIKSELAHRLSSASAPSELL